MANKSVAFLSYAHRDDDHHDGAITTLCAQLSKAVSVAIGEDFEIFLDRQDIAWGQHWPSRLDQGLEEGRFLIPILSPSFFNSSHCRDELEKFLEIERAAARRDLILPIYFVTCPLLENQAKRDAHPLAKALAQRQFRDWRHLRHKPFTDYEVRRELDSLAEEIVQALERLAASETPVVDEEVVPQPAADVAKSGGVLQEDQPEFVERERPAQAPAVGSTAALAPGTVFRDMDAPWCPELVVVPAGSFVMGSPPDEEGHRENEEPEHRVRIRQPFPLGLYPVTFEEFDHFCIETARRKPGDQGWGRDRRPVINVSWEDAQAYLSWLGEETGQRYHLPSEAEWEYACRAGTTTPFSTGTTISTDQANYDGSEVYGGGKKGKYRERTIEVGSFPPNPFALYDMHGNVWEWVEDCWNASYEGAPTDGTAWLQGDCSLRVLRGGSWDDGPENLRSAFRDRYQPDFRSSSLGFRVARAFTP